MCKKKKNKPQKTPEDPDLTTALAFTGLDRIRKSHGRLNFPEP